MRKPSVGIVPEGLPIISLLALATLSCAMLGCGWATGVCFILCVFACSFFRNPARVISEEKDAAVSPADGKVVKIATRPNPFSGEPCICVSVFMSIFNVHVNRAPVAGIITSIRYHEGKFINASLDKASEGNERCSYELLGESGDRWAFVQIAGLVARRIVPWVEKGDSLRRGECFGLIRFGSRVDLYLPDEYIPACAVGQKIFAGQSVIARKGAAQDGAMRDGSAADERGESGETVTPDAEQASPAAQAGEPAQESESGPRQ